MKGKNQMKIKTYLPIFSGFYGTNWEFNLDDVDNFIQYERKEKGLFSDYKANDVKIDYGQYETDIIKNICKILPDFMSDFINSIELEKIVSPKAYNFSNDSANVIIDINEKAIKDFMINNIMAFKTFLKQKYTSHDGFISHYSNNSDIWQDETNNFTDFSTNGHYLGSVLDFIANMLKIDNYLLYENIMEKINYIDYVENLEEIINKHDGTLFEFLTMNKYSKNYADYIELSYNNGIINILSLDEKTLSIIKEFENQEILA
jgi:hypothetical protein